MYINNQLFVMCMFIKMDNQLICDVKGKSPKDWYYFRGDKE